LELSRRQNARWEYGEQWSVLAFGLNDMLGEWAAPSKQTGFTLETMSPKAVQKSVRGDVKQSSTGLSRLFGQNGPRQFRTQERYGAPPFRAKRSKTVSNQKRAMAPGPSGRGVESLAGAIIRRHSAIQRGNDGGTLSADNARNRANQSDGTQSNPDGRESYFKRCARRTAGQVVHVARRAHGKQSAAA
jgi:hypothetical protein